MILNRVTPLHEQHLIKKKARMLSKCLTENKIPKLWRQSKILGILKPGKDAAIPNSFRPISLLCHIYNLYKRMILNRVTPLHEQHLIKKKARMLSKCLTENKIPKLWRQSKILGILKPGKDAAIPKSYRPISLLCHIYNLYKRMILNRVTSLHEQYLIKEKVFRPVKSCINQLLNMILHIEDRYQRGMITGASFVDLSAAYNMVNHRILIQKCYNITWDSQLCRVLPNMFSNIIF